MANTSLITLQTDLKSLRYGSDKPYVAKSIGQAPGSQVGQEISHRIDDTSRIAQMLVDKPGLKYLLREAQLQQIGVEDRIQKARKKGKSIAGAVLGELGNTAVGTVKIIGSTLAQVPVNGTGTHFLKGFRTDTYLRPGANEKTPRAFAAFFGAGGVEGAPLALQGKPIEGEVKSNFGTKEGALFTVDSDTLGQYSYDGPVRPEYNEKQNDPQIRGYYSEEGKTKTAAQSGNPIYVGPTQRVEIRAPFTGGAIPLDLPLTPETTATPNTNTAQNLIKSIPHTGSISRDINPDSSNNVSSTSYSYGNTFTGTSTDTAITNAQNNSPIKVTAPGTGPRETTATSGSSLVAGTANTGYTDENTSNPADKLDLRQPVTSSYSSNKDYYTEQKTRKINGTEKNVIKETRVNLGDQGRKKAAAYYTDYSTTDELSVDKLNALDIQNSRPDGVDEARDLAKFFFEIITPEGSKFLNFRAFITSMDDSYNANWEAKKYVGRADDFYTYGGFSRDINVGFKIAAATRSEMKPLYRKMVYLASTTAPTYGDYKFMRGTVVRLSLGSYFNEIPGVITSVKYTWSTDYPWEIAMESPEGGESGVQELPMIMDCSISFKPIHDFVPQTGLQHYITSKEPSKTFF